MPKSIFDIPNLSEFSYTKFYKIFCEYIVDIEREFNNYQQQLPRSQRIDSDYNNIVASYLRNIFTQCFERLNIAFTIMDLSKEAVKSKDLSRCLGNLVCYLNKLYVFKYL